MKKEKNEVNFKYVDLHRLNVTSSFLVHSFLKYAGRELLLLFHVYIHGWTSILKDYDHTLLVCMNQQQLDVCQ